MNFIRLYRILGPLDWKNVKRDSMLAWLMLIPIGVGLLARWGVPELTLWLATQFDFDLVPHHSFIMGFLLPLPAALVGAVIGFLLLDERDEQTLAALMVTPLPLMDYVLYRLSAPVIAGTLSALLVYPLVNLVPLPWVTLVVVAALSSLAAPQLALALGTLAENKVGGLALQKALGAILFLPVAAYFLAEPWQWLAGILPTYWPMKVFWLAAAGRPFLIPVLVGVAVNLVYLVFLVRLFNRVIHR